MALTLGELGDFTTTQLDAMSLEELLVIVRAANTSVVTYCDVDGLLSFQQQRVFSKVSRFLRQGFAQFSVQNMTVLFATGEVDRLLTKCAGLSSDPQDDAMDLLKEVWKTLKQMYDDRLA